MLKKTLLVFAGIVLTATLALDCQVPKQQPYLWRSVQIVGGGFVDGIIFHPSASGVRYARTDMGGAYRWDDVAGEWKPILDWLSYKDLNLMGVESIAIDPHDPKRVYLACGTYTNTRTPNGAILRSDDGGRTFHRTDVPFKFGGNEDGRGNGERMMVDPHDGRILFLGTRHDGLWRSGDRGVTWSRVTTFPDVTEPAPPMPVREPGETPEHFWHRMPVRGDGIVFVTFLGSLNQPSADSPTRTIYVGASLMGRTNLFVSHDAGQSWQPVAGAPTAYRPTRAAVADNRFLYVTYGNAPGPSPMTDGAVWKLDTQTGTWNDITPDKPVKGSREFGYAAVSVDALHPQTLIVSTYNRYKAGGEDIFRSTDGGTTWRPIFGAGGTGAIFDYSLAPYVKPTPIHWLFDIEIDPLNSNHAVFTTGYGGWQTFDLTAADHGKPTHWSILAKGIEETVALDMASPSQGAHLVSAIGDYGGFVHWDMDEPAPEGSSAPPRMGNTTSVAVAALDPKLIVRVGVSAEHKPRESIGYSLDGGRTWQPCSGTPDPQSRSGTIAVSANGNSWIWIPDHENAYLTHDRGATWTAVQGLPARARVVADPQDTNVFYALSFADRVFYRSSDGGKTFSAQSFSLPPRASGAGERRGDPRGGQDQIYAAPGGAGDLWLAAFDGLYHATGYSTAISFAAMPGVEEIHAFGFGKAAPGHSYPAMYLAGSVDGQSGIFRSEDEAKTWIRINDDQHQWGLILQISGDPRIYGRVYVGTHGRGILYGDPATR